MVFVLTIKLSIHVLVFAVILVGSFIVTINSYDSNRSVKSVTLEFTLKKFRLKSPPKITNLLLLTILFSKPLQRLRNKSKLSEGGR